MRHESVRLETPCEIINVTPCNPLISKCQIKVCYVSDKPNRNRSIITKEVAREMANSLPGSPIVGFYNEATEDFEEHNRSIDIVNGEFKIKDTTKPYGFVDLGAKCWFQKFQDDGETEHEYLMTEGYIWTGQYPESKRIIEHGNNQSMELDEKTLNATWTKDNNGKPKFFIINEAIISKLCILGEECEPCFEGSTITKVQFSFEDGFKEQLFSMINEVKELLQGGTTVFDEKELKEDLQDNLDETNAEFKQASSKDEEEDEKKKKDSENVDSEAEEEEKKKKEKEFKCGGSNEEEDEEKKKKKEFKKQDKKDETDKEKSDNNSEDKESEDSSSEEEDSSSDDKSAESENKDKEDEDKKKKNKYNLEEIPEYTKLASKFLELETKYSQLKVEKENLESQIAPLIEFKNNAERLQKEDMINKTFYMLSAEDKKDVIDNIDKYSLDDIEAKLSIICVRNKVNFAALEDELGNIQEPTTYHLGTDSINNESTPAWVKAVLDTAKTLN